MTQPAKVQEPSMEEILASIRRIIADDEAKPPAADTKPPAGNTKPPAGDTKPPAADMKAPAPELKPVPEVKPAPVEKPPAPPPSAAVKAEKPAAAAPPPKPAMADIPPSKIAPAPKTPSPPPAARPAPAPAASAGNNQDDIDALLNGLDEATSEEEIRAPQPDDPEVFELTDDMAVPNVAPQPQPSFHKIEPEDDLEFTESAASRAINRPPAYEPPAFDPPPVPQAAILSQSTVSAVESAFNTLAHTVLSNNARTLEDLVKEMLRPMLKSWLDDNLPGLVERIVKAEIERVSRGR
jgi:cell pole-organizing protein PopZ